MLGNSDKSVKKIMNDVGVVVKDHISKLFFKINEENKCMQTTIDYIKNMPIVLKLEKELKESRIEIDRLKSLLENDDSQMIKLKMNEINNNKTSTSYDEISKLVSDKVYEKSSTSDLLKMYLETSESDDDEDENDTIACKEEKTPIEIPYKHFLGLPKLDLDGAECSNSETETCGELDEDSVKNPDGETGKVFAYESDHETDHETVEEPVEESDHEPVEESVEESVEEPVDNSDHESVDGSEEELEVDEVEINGKLYFATDDKNGVLYDVDEDGDIGDEIGYLKNGKAFFS